jgi:hypothetical protein
MKLVVAGVNPAVRSYAGSARTLDSISAFVWRETTFSDLGKLNDGISDEASSTALEPPRGADRSRSLTICPRRLWP